MTKNSMSNNDGLLSRDFFARNTLIAANELLGCVVVKRDNNAIKKGNHSRDRRLWQRSLNQGSRTAGNLENTNGPGKICRELEINRTHNGIDICSKV